MEKPVLLTAEGLEKLEKELEELRTVKRAEVAERIRYAKGFGDLSENAEYEDAKNEQGMIEGRILVLETMIRNAQLIEDSHKGVVGVGSLVTITDEFGEETFTIVGPAEVDVESGKISLESPVGKSLIGHKVGDAVQAVCPGGLREIKILKIK